MTRTTRHITKDIWNALNKPHLTDLAFKLYSKMVDVLKIDWYYHMQKYEYFIVTWENGEAIYNA